MENITLFQRDFLPMEWNLCVWGAFTHFEITFAHVKQLLNSFALIFNVYNLVFLNFIRLCDSSFCDFSVFNEARVILPWCFEKLCSVCEQFKCFKETHLIYICAIFSQEQNYTQHKMFSCSELIFHTHLSLG